MTSEVVQQFNQGVQMW